MANNVKVLKFLTEEIIAEVINQTDTTITLKNPLRIVVVPNKMDPRNPSVGFAPYCEWTEEKTFVLSTNMLVFQTTPIKMFLDQYNQTFSTLILPETELISKI